VSDPLGRVEPGPPCPSCGYRVSLDKLHRVRDELLDKKARLPKKIPPIQAGQGLSVQGSKTIQLAGGISGGGGTSVGVPVTGAGVGVPISAVQCGNAIQGDPLVNNGASDGWATKAYVDGMSGGQSIAIDGEICAKCGTFWKPDAAKEAATLHAQIIKLRLELESAVDLLGRLPDA